MSKHDELVKALRYCVNARNCEKCAYRINNNSVKCRIQRVENAAAAIEELQAEVESSEQNCKQQLIAMARHNAELQAEVKRLEPKRGEWIKRHEFVEDTPFIGFRCSICNWWKGDFEKYNYCPKCGAKMEVQE